MEDIREIRGDLKLMVGKLAEMDAARRKPRIPTSTLEDQLAASIEKVNAARRHEVQLELIPSESSGPVLVPAMAAPPAPPRRPPSGGRVPYGVALRQITRVVVSALNEAGEQWDDDSRKSLICTLFIAATKDKRITFDFDQEAA
jgi:hypothetical protein